MACVSLVIDPYVLLGRRRIQTPAAKRFASDSTSAHPKPRAGSARRPRARRRSPAQEAQRRGDDLGSCRWGWPRSLAVSSRESGHSGHSARSDQGTSAWRCRAHHAGRAITARCGAPATLEGARVRFQQLPCGGRTAAPSDERANRRWHGGPAAGAIIWRVACSQCSRDGGGDPQRMPITCAAGPPAVRTQALQTKSAGSQASAAAAVRLR